MSSNEPSAPGATRSPLLRGTETTRLTVAGPVRRVDLTVPATVPIAELLPVLLRRVVDNTARDQPWVLQRLGEEPLDPDSTAEEAELRHGEVLHLRPADRALPPVQFDDVAVGMASVIGARHDRWQPAFTRRLQLALAGLSLLAFGYGALRVSPAGWSALCLGAAAVLLTAGGVVAGRLFRDVPVCLITGLSGCALAALAGLSARHGVAGIGAPGRVDVLLASLSAAAAAALLLAVGHAPATPFGAVLGTAAAGAVGCGLALSVRWDADRASAVLAVAIFLMSFRAVRMILRAARLRVPQLPRTAEELQQDIEPEPGERLTRRSAVAVACLDSLIISGSLVSAVAFVQLARTPQWIDWTLTAALAAALLLRSRDLAGVWQRTFLAVAGTFGLAVVAETLAARAGPLLGTVALFAVLAVAGLLLIAARRPPGSRLLPIWGHIADLLEMGTAVGLLPLLLQLLHVYGHIRHLVN
jgi:type VII secretion integral membrane protein EccD